MRDSRLREVFAYKRWSLTRDGQTNSTNSEFLTSPTHKRVVDNRWLFMAGSDYRPLNDKKLVFCIGSHSEE